MSKLHFKDFYSDSLLALFKLLYVQTVGSKSNKSSKFFYSYFQDFATPVFRLLV